MLDQAAETQLARGGPLPGLLVGEVAGGEAQEVPLLGERLQQVGALAADGRCRGGLVEGVGWFMGAFFRESSSVCEHHVRSDRGQILS